MLQSPAITATDPSTKAPKPVFTTKVIPTKAPSQGSGSGSGSGTTTPGEDELGGENDLDINEAPIPVDPKEEVTTTESGALGGNETPLLPNNVVGFLIEILG